MSRTRLTMLLRPRDMVTKVLVDLVVARIRLI